MSLWSTQMSTCPPPNQVQFMLCLGFGLLLPQPAQHCPSTGRNSCHFPNRVLVHSSPPTWIHLLWAVAHILPFPTFSHILTPAPWHIWSCDIYGCFSCVNGISTERGCPCFFKLPTVAKEATIQHEPLRMAPSPRILSRRLSNMGNHVRRSCGFLPASLSGARCLEFSYPYAFALKTTNSSFSFGTTPNNQRQPSFAPSEATKLCPFFPTHLPYELVKYTMGSIKHS